MISDLLRPWRTERTWRALVHLVLNLPIGVALFSVTLPLVVLTFSLVPTVLGAFVSLWLLLVLTRIAGRVERSRIAALLDLTLVDLTTPPPKSVGWWRRQWRMIRTRQRWKDLAYCLLRFPTGAVMGTAVSFAWAGSLALIALPLYRPLLPLERATFGFVKVDSVAGTLAVAVVGLAGLVIGAPWLTVGLAHLERLMARALLGRTAEAVLGERVEALESSRSAAIGSAEAERRRIERDLHDGAQQRLISVAMSLGVARTQLTTDPERGRQLVATAHEDVKAALKEIRDLVRGIHPVVLQDRGLDAALSAVVARTAVPVHLRIDVDDRPDPSIESAAYFIVSEALVNVDRHSQALRATVEISRHHDRLTIAVSDNGVGGADASRGTGLTGLQERVTGLGGTLRIISPTGGPTTLIVEVPCGS